MTAPATTAGSGSGTAARHRIVAVVLATTGLLLVVHTLPMRVFEAWVSARLVGGIRHDTLAVGSTLLVQVGDQWVGLHLVTGCSVGPLIGVMTAGVAPFVWFRAVPLLRLFRALGLLVATLFVVNQIRFAVIVISMRVWGPDRGFELSHVFFGSTISTVGFVLSLLVFARLLAAPGRTRNRDASADSAPAAPTP